MKFLHALKTFAVAGALMLTGCVDDSISDTQAVTEQISESLMPNAPEAPGEFQVARNHAGEWFFNALGANGEIMLLSQTYQEQASALNGILSVEENGVLLERYEVSGADESWSFVLRAGNGQVIADSPLYRSAEDADAGVMAARELVAGILQYKAAATKGARFDLWREKGDNKWYFVLLTADGRVLLASQSYTGRTNAVTGLQSVRLNGKDLTRYQIKGAEGEVFLSLKAANGKEIASSGPHASIEAAEAIKTEANELLLSERVGNPW
jgi:hypothetical protein